jgi:hypothetical protein
MMDPVSGALQEIQAALDSLRIPFCIVGSYASSARGEARATMDVDLLARISEVQADGLAQALGSAWSVDVEAVREALRRRRAFNIFNLPAGLKFDIFPALDDFHTAQLDRATGLRLADGAGPYPVATAEDMVLAKLQWYRMGGEVSERQWRDILGLLLAGPLDAAYLRYWASRLRVDDLLSRALAEAGPDRAQGEALH